MAGKKEDETYPCCKRGNLIAFGQWTDNGYVVCGVIARLASARGVAPRASPIRPGPWPKARLSGEKKLPGPAPFPAIVGEVSCARAG